MGGHFLRSEGVSEGQDSEHGGAGLRRALGLVALTAFGVGDILGAGVYGLVGKIAGLAGTAAWVSYVLAGLTAALTGLTYAELASRYPRAGGAAHFCEAAFGRPLLTFLVIFFVGSSGLFSMATASRVFADYALAAAPEVPAWLREGIVPAALVCLLALVAAIGIKFSSGTNAVCTVIEVAGLLAIIAVGIPFLGRVSYLRFPTPPPESSAAMSHGLAALTGASVAFFAFIGFEDMVNMAEETHDPERTVPLGICLAILITTIIYCAIALVSVSVLPPEALSGSRSPLLDVVRAASPRFPLWVYSVIPAFAVFNTALLNLLMASRLLYGMARQESGLVPAVFGYVEPRRRTPIVGVGFSAVVAAVLAVGFRDVKTLASGTSTFLLVVFCLLHVGLLCLKRRAGASPAFRIPSVVPVGGILTTLLLLLRQDPAALGSAGALGVVALLLFAAHRITRGRVTVRGVD
jgi:amino acid transporter